jgi:hypothetical protein
VGGEREGELFFPPASTVVRMPTHLQLPLLSSPLPPSSPTVFLPPLISPTHFRRDLLPLCRWGPQCRLPGRDGVVDHLLFPSDSRREQDCLP